MPKLKTRTSVKKRIIKITAKGKLKVKSAFMNHILKSKSPDQKRKLRSASYVAKVDAPRFKKFIVAG